MEQGGCIRRYRTVRSPTGPALFVRSMSSPSPVGPGSWRCLIERTRNWSVTAAIWRQAGIGRMDSHVVPAVILKVASSRLREANKVLPAALGRDVYSATNRHYYLKHKNYVRFEVFTAGTMRNAVFWDIKSHFVPHGRHITSPLLIPASQCHGRFEVFTAVTMKNAIFWDIKTQFVLHRRHITSPLQSPAG
jgi:hypothetical protein